MSIGGFLVILVIGWFVYHNAYGTLDGATSTDEAQEHSPAKTAEAKLEEEKKCAADAKCFSNKHLIDASVRCRRPIEKLAGYNFEWTNSWYEPRFSRFNKADPQSTVVTYIGDKIKFQNAFGAWQLMTYECDYDAASDKALDVRIATGQLP